MEFSRQEYWSGIAIPFSMGSFWPSYEYLSLKMISGLWLTIFDPQMEKTDIEFNGHYFLRLYTTVRRWVAFILDYVLLSDWSSPRYFLFLFKDYSLHMKMYYIKYFLASYEYYAFFFSLSLLSRVQPHRQQPTRLLCPWDSPGKNTGVGCHFLLPQRLWEMINFIAFSSY